MKNSERHFFAGGNTKYGFFSYFNYIINPESLCTYILKGGSGVGKSTVMKTFAQAMEDNNYFVEYIHCASDEDSLDGVCIPELGVTVLDGTAPHTVDPILPGAFDQIINLGAWLNTDILMQRKQEIAAISKEKSRLYGEAYSYMKSASHLLDINHTLYERNTDLYGLASLADELSDELFLENLKKTGSKKNLFAGAFTSNGLIDYSSTLLSKVPSEHAHNGIYDLWEVHSDSMCCISEFLETISTNGVKRGYDMECFCFPTEPHKIQHLLIPKLGIAIMSNVNMDSAKKTIDLNNFLNTSELLKHKSTIANNEALFSNLMSLASQTLAKTKNQHDLLEQIYSSAMDYSKVDQLVDKLVTQYLGTEGGH